MYACGHNSQGDTVPEYWELLPPERMPLSTGLCPKCVRSRYEYPVTQGEN